MSRILSTSTATASNCTYSEKAEGTTNKCVCRVKCVLVGDGAVGKTSLIIGYTTNAYPKEYRPTAYDKYSVVVSVNNKPVRLQICDTAGQDDFDALRPLCYSHTDIFLLCFSVVYPTSFYNVAEKWIYEIRHHCPKAPVLLVGTQSDLRTDIGVLLELAHYGEQPVSIQQANTLASQIGAISYVECSAVTKRNLKEVFDTALMSALKTKKANILLTDNCSDSEFKSYSMKSSHDYTTDDKKKSGLKKLWCFS
ncbi:cell division control protein 42 homolog [Stegodyphus dumicola]|uniref:cell division control protein 42 homolog n=1 Tax=Stegodyphus dumicola TaxID=202533 RepID=UPI0015B10DAB|nr:cell division control protein 42 homolog [Stegodyphus dumicola]